MENILPQMVENTVSGRFENVPLSAYHYREGAFFGMAAHRRTKKIDASLPQPRLAISTVASGDVVLISMTVVPRSA